MSATAPSLDFSGLHVVVTGGTGALGRAVVDGLTAAGAHCHVPVWSAAELDSFAPTRPAQVTTTLGVDLRDSEQVTAWYAALPQLWASIHITGGFAMSPALDTSAEAFEGMFRLNALSCFLCCREAARNMALDRGQSSGRIVNVAARPALAPAGGMVAYSVSKAAVVSLTQSLAAEWLADGVLVNAIAPSIMDTPDNRAAMPTADHSAWPKVVDVAATMAWLASPANALTSGCIVPVYGRA